MTLASMSYMSYIWDMLSIRLGKDMEDRLERVALQTGRTKSYYARQAIEEKIEEMEDMAVAIERIENPGKTVSLEELAKELNVDLGR